MKTLISFIKINFLFSQIVLSAFLTALLGIWVYRYGGKETLEIILDGNRSAIYGALVSVFGSLLGFTITAESIVLSVSDHKSLQIIKESCHYKTLWQIFIYSIRCLSLATFLSLIGLIFDREKNPAYWIFVLVFGVIILGCFSIATSIWMLENIVDLVSSSNKTSKKFEE